ncbi:MAG TPA: PIG-L family deacetylase, partial [Rhodothermales bacterium]|nr:PIG-L family deacetylase [Rhodothermales bacterium]
MRLLVLLLFTLAAAAPAHAQLYSPAPRVVMNLAAHPDDEDGATMAYYRHAQEAVVYSVVYTRGEGGQNEIGPDLYERLGALRTAETEHAARILGTQVWWLNFYDFGFTKWGREAFTEWSRPRHGFWDTGVPVGTEAAGRDTVTARLVYLIRRLKPDVIFTNHDTLTVGPRAQHGQHQAVGLSAWAAFALSADPTYHPEQLAEPGVDLWQPQRLFVRDRSGDGADVAVPVADSCGYSESCSDMAVRAAVLHRTQGFDKLAPRFFRRDTSYFTLYRAAPGAPPLPEGATDLTAGLPPNPHAAHVSTSYLRDSGYDRRGWTNRYDASPPVVVPGGTLHMEWVARSGPAGIVALRATDTGDTLHYAGGVRVGADYVLPPDFRPTLPAARAQYGRMQASPPIEIEIRGGATGYVDVEVAPPVVVDLAPAPVRLVRGVNTLPVRVHIYDSTATSARLTLRVERPDGSLLTTATRTVAAGDTTATLDFTLPERLPPGPARVVIEAVATPATVAGGAPYVETRPAALLPDIRVSRGLRVGFVRSYDETTEQALRAMGADVVLLDSTALAEGRFD